MKIKSRRTNIMPEHLRAKKQFSGYGSFHRIIVSRNMYGEYYKLEYSDNTITQSTISEFEAEDLIGRGHTFYDALRLAEVSLQSY